jgi:hypothetical protein
VHLFAGKCVKLSRFFEALQACGVLHTYHAHLRTLLAMSGNRAYDNRGDKPSLSMPKLMTKAPFWPTSFDGAPPPLIKTRQRSCTTPYTIRPASHGYTSRAMPVHARTWICSSSMSPIHRRSRAGNPANWFAPRPCGAFVNGRGKT